MTGKEQTVRSTVPPTINVVAPAERVAVVTGASSGIGEATAKKIVADREANGPFKSVDEVQRVKGIGPATLEKMRPWLVCGEAPAH